MALGPADTAFMDKNRNRIFDYRKTPNLSGGLNKG